MLGNVWGDGVGWGEREASATHKKIDTIKKKSIHTSYSKECNVILRLDIGLNISFI
jgi:hypothetical protein